MFQIKALSNHKKLFFHLVPLFIFTLVVLFVGPTPISKINNEKSANPKIKIDVAKVCENNQVYQCYKTAFIQAIQTGDIKGTLATLKFLNDTNSTVRTYCHSLAHDLGRTAYDATGGDIGRIFTEGDTTCWSGFFHGALEKAFSYSVDLNKTAADLCTEKHDVKGSFLTYQCLHGLGHGLSARFDNEIYSALKVCQSLSTSYEQSSCYGGVFMENYVADGINHKTRYTSSNDPIAPCNKVAETYKYNCYQLVSIQILKLNSYNFGAAFKTCLQSDSNYIDVCYQSVGRDISGYTAENYDQALADCALGNQTAERICVMAVSTDSVYSRSSPANAKIICTKAKDYLKEACYQAAGSSIQVLYDDKSKRLEACKSYEEKYQKVCKTAAGVS